MRRGRAQKFARSERARPDIFSYHEYRSFLRDWFAYLKDLKPEFSVRALAQASGLSSGYFSMLLSGERKLTLDALARFLQNLELSRGERSFFERLVRFAETEDQAKIVALDRMARSPSYRKRNPQEAEFLEYMSHWHYVAIRELAALPDFLPDPEWIQGRLKHKVTLLEVRTALDFLTRHGYLRLGRDGASLPPKNTLTCKGPVYWPALTQFHRQMFQLAAESIEGTHSSERSLEGFTFSLDQERFEAAQEILLKAMSDIEGLEKDARSPVDRVYHLELAFFPLTRKKGEK